MSFMYFKRSMNPTFKAFARTMETLSPENKKIQRSSRAFGL